MGVGDDSRVQGEKLRSCSGKVVKGELGGCSSVKGSEATEFVEKDNGGDLRSRSWGWGINEKVLSEWMVIRCRLLGNEEWQVQEEAAGSPVCGWWDGALTGRI